MSEKARFVDATALAMAVRTMPHSHSSSYSGGAVDTVVNQLISTAVMGAMIEFKMRLADAIEQAGQPYDKCMLCVQRDCDVVPSF